MIHRGEALLYQVIGAVETLKEKEGLKVMWPVVREVRDELNKTNPPVDIDRAANISGHCKLHTMHNKSLVRRLVFVMPEIVICGGRTTTLGSVVS